MHRGRKQRETIRFSMNTTPVAPEGFEAAKARLNAWRPFVHHTFSELQAHEADLRFMPIDDGTDGPVWETRS